MTTFLILAAGASTRFDGDKLLERFNGFTLPQYAVKFAQDNGATRICVTLAERQTYTDGRYMRHAILDDLQELCEPEIALQPSQRYGTGAAVSVWQQRIEEPTVVLFGDNFYKGTLPSMDDDALCYSTITRNEPARQNLQLASVLEGFVIEKPHQQLKGTFFAGFIKMPASSWNTLPKLQASSRNEYEITDIINASPTRKAIALEEHDLIWDGITYADDVQRIQALLA